MAGTGVFTGWATNENPFYQPTTMHVMNPKAVWMEELYGEVNEITREWTDGILSNIARKACRDITVGIEIFFAKISSQKYASAVFSPSVAQFSALQVQSI